MRRGKQGVIASIVAIAVCAGTSGNPMPEAHAAGRGRSDLGAAPAMGGALARGRRLAAPQWRPRVASTLAVTWTLQANIPNPLPPSNAEASFGAGVSLDKDTLLVGAEATPGSNQYGAAYLYQRQGSTWTQQTVLADPQNTLGDDYGRTVALSGTIAVVGGELLTGAVVHSGAAYVYQNQGGSWVHTQLLAPSDGIAYDGFAASMARSGNTLAIGAPGKYAGIGAVYIYTWNGTSWRFQAEIPSPLHVPGLNFGNVVALSGNTLAVGAFGIAYVYGRSGSAWTLQATLTDTSGEPGLIYGESVGVSGSTVAVGACCDYLGQQNGLVDIFTRSGGTWSKQTTLRSPWGPVDIIFGQFLALQGTTVATVGTLGLYLFSRANGVWSELTSFTNSDANLAVVGPFSFSGNTLAATAGAYYPTDSIDIFVRSLTPGLDVGDENMDHRLSRSAAR